MKTLILIRRFCIGTYFGIALMAAMAAPVVFYNLESKTLAGKIFGQILSKMNVIEIILLSVILFIGLITIQGKKKIITTIITLLMLLNWFYYAQTMTNRMDVLRSQISSFDTPNSSDSTPKAEFDVLHQRYTKMMSANMIGSIVLGLIP